MCIRPLQPGLGKNGKDTSSIFGQIPGARKLKCVALALSILAPLAGCASVRPSTSSGLGSWPAWVNTRAIDHDENVSSDLLISIYILELPSEGLFQEAQRVLLGETTRLQAHATVLERLSASDIEQQLAVAAALPACAIHKLIMMHVKGTPGYYYGDSLHREELYGVTGLRYCPETGVFVSLRLKEWAAGRGVVRYNVQGAQGNQVTSATGSVAWQVDEQVVLSPNAVAITFVALQNTGTGACIIAEVTENRSAPSEPLTLQRRSGFDVFDHFDCGLLHNGAPSTSEDVEQARLQAHADLVECPRGQDFVFAEAQ